VRRGRERARAGLARRVRQNADEVDVLDVEEISPVREGGEQGRCRGDRQADLTDHGGVAAEERAERGEAVWGGPGEVGDVERRAHGGAGVAAPGLPAPLDGVAIGGDVARVVLGEEAVGPALALADAVPDVLGSVERAVGLVGVAAVAVADAGPVVVGDGSPGRGAAGVWEEGGGDGRVADEAGVLVPDGSVEPVQRGVEAREGDAVGVHLADAVRHQLRGDAGSAGLGRDGDAEDAEHRHGSPRDVEAHGDASHAAGDPSMALGDADVGAGHAVLEPVDTLVEIGAEGEGGEARDGLDGLVGGDRAQAAGCGHGASLPVEPADRLGDVGERVAAPAVSALVRLECHAGAGLAERVAGGLWEPHRDEVLG
jgi:hypothetical protein